MCNSAKQWQDNAAKCKSSGLSYRNLKVFEFPKSALNSGGEVWAEERHKTCWGDDTLSRKKLVATSSVISFIGKNEEDQFNISRETLRAGAQADWDCSFIEKANSNKL